MQGERICAARCEKEAERSMARAASYPRAFASVRSSTQGARLRPASSSALFCEHCEDEELGRIAAIGRGNRRGAHATRPDRGVNTMTAETLLIWLFVGAVAGWLASVIVQGYGF